MRYEQRHVTAGSVMPAWAYTGCGWQVLCHDFCPSLGTSLTLGAGSLNRRTTDPSLRESSTIARSRNDCLIVNPDFSNQAIPYTITGLPRGYEDDR